MPDPTFDPLPGPDATPAERAAWWARWTERAQDPSLAEGILEPDDPDRALLGRPPEGG